MKLEVVMFDISISIENNKVLGKFIVDSYFFDPSKYDYAFYLYKDGEKVNTTRYKKSMEVAFDLKDFTGILQIKAYIRDVEQGNKRSFYSEKISIAY
jgi:hypothetical protein